MRGIQGRRLFLILSGAASLGGFLMLAAVAVGRFLGYGRPRVGGPRRIAVGTLDDFPPDTLKLRKGIWIGHDEKGLYAMLNLCTHLGCSPRWEAGGGSIICPCHGSRFDIHGNVLRGPAKRPLKRLKLIMNNNGTIIVDPNLEVGEGFRLLP